MILIGKLNQSYWVTIYIVGYDVASSIVVALVTCVW